MEQVLSRLRDESGPNVMVPNVLLDNVLLDSDDEWCKKGIILPGSMLGLLRDRLRTFGHDQFNRYRSIR